MTVLVTEQLGAHSACIDDNGVNNVFLHFFFIDYSLDIVGENEYSGRLNLTHKDIEGRICADNWDDKDARVACREMGYQEGVAYLHYRSNFAFVEHDGPYWTSALNCTGNETKLTDCPHIAFGSVAQCRTRHYAGVVCYNDMG